MAPPLSQGLNGHHGNHDQLPAGVYPNMSITASEDDNWKIDNSNQLPYNRSVKNETHKSTYENPTEGQDIDSMQAGNFSSIAFSSLNTDASFLHQFSSLRSKLVETMQQNISMIPQLEESLLRKSEECHKEHARVLELQFEIQKLKMDYDSLSNMNNSIISTSRKEQELLQSELAVQKSVSLKTKSMIEAIQSQLEESAQKIAQLILENETLSCSNASLHQAQADLSLKLEQLESELAALMTATDGMEPNKRPSYSSVLTENVALSTQLTAEQKENERLRACLESIAASLEENTPKLVEGEKAIERLDGLAIEFEQLLSAHQQTTSQLEMALNSKATLERQALQSDSIIQELERQIRVLLAQVEGIQQNDDEISGENSAFRTFSELQSKYRKLMESNYELSCTISELETEIQRLNEEKVTESQPVSSEIMLAIPSTIKKQEEEEEVKINAARRLETGIITALEQRISDLQEALRRRDQDVTTVQQALQSALTHADALRLERTHVNETLLATKAALAVAQADSAGLASELRMAQSTLVMNTTRTNEERLSLQTALTFMEKRLQDTETLYSTERKDFVNRIQTLESTEALLRSQLNEAERLTRSLSRNTNEETLLAKEELHVAKQEKSIVEAKLEAAENELQQTLARLESSDKRLDLVLSLSSKKPKELHDATHAHELHSPEPNIETGQGPNLQAPQLARKYLQMAEEAVSLREENARAKEESAKLMKRIEDLLNDLENSRAKESDFYIKMSALESKTVDLQASLKLYEERELVINEEKDRLQLELEESRTMLSSIIKRHGADLERLHICEKIASDAQNELQETKGQLIQLEAALRSTEGERDAAEAASRALIAQRQGDQNHPVSEVAALEIAALEMEAQRLRMALARMETERIHRHIDHEKTESNESSIQMKALIESNLLLREQIDILTSSQKNIQITPAEREELQASIDQLRSSRDELMLEIREVAAIRDALQVKYDSVAQQLEVVQAMASGKNAIILEQSGELETNKREISDLHHRIEILENTLSIKTDRIKSIIEKYNAMKEKFISEKTELEARISALELKEKECAENEEKSPGEEDRHFGRDFDIKGETSNEPVVLEGIGHPVNEGEELQGLDQEHPEDFISEPIVPVAELTPPPEIEHRGENSHDEAKTNSHPGSPTTSFDTPDQTSLQQKQEDLRQLLLKKLSDRQPDSLLPGNSPTDSEGKKPFKKITPPEFESSVLQSYINPYLKRQKAQNVDKKRLKKKK